MEQLEKSSKNSELLNLGDISVVILDNPERTRLWDNKNNCELNQSEAKDHLRNLSEDQLDLLRCFVFINK